MLLSADVRFCKLGGYSPCLSPLRYTSRMGYRTYTCPYAKNCGGCEWLAVPYPIQLKRKLAGVEGLLGEMAAADGARVEDVIGMAEPLAYRHKAATPFAPRGKGGHKIACGFYARGTHRIVRCESCLVEVPMARPLFEAVARIATELGISAYKEDAGRGCLRHAILRAGWKTPDAMLTVVANGQKLVREQDFVRAVRAAEPRLSTIVLNTNQKRTNAMLGRDSRALFGSGTMRDELLGCTFEIGPTSFYQTNPSQTEALYQVAIEAAALESGMRVLDAYCGCGTIGICAAQAVPGAEVLGVEKGVEAIGRARVNARLNGVSERCSFVAADATEWILAAARAGERFDVVLMDPPRAGSTPEFLGAVASLAPKRVVYVSCNVETQARDVALLRERGYRLARVTPVDMFPHTKHVECVCLLERA